MAFDAYFKLEKGKAGEIEGESTDASHKGWIELTHYELGAETVLNIGSKSGGAGAGKANFGALVIEKQPDQTSPVFFLALCSGAHYETGTLSICRATGDEKKEPFLKFEFKLVAVSSITNSGSEGDDYPSERIEMEYGALKWTYRAQDDKGNLKPAIDKSWSRVTNKPKFEV